MLVDAIETFFPVFTPAFSRFNNPAYISVLLGRCYSSSQLLEVTAALTYIERQGIKDLDGMTWSTVRQMRDAVRTTRLIDALNRGRRWARASLVERLSPMLEQDIAIAIAVVPSHDPWTTDTPIRQVAQELAAGAIGTAGEGREDATSCLIRHTAITRIVFGGPSNPSLHRRTIRVERPELIEGRRVLLLDDVAKSGQSLLACRQLLYEAGASVVQAAALGRVIGGEVNVKPV
jgi:phosphoribosylpyrophosphate synthetase